jgi:hypothetical protein
MPQEGGCRMLLATAKLGGLSDSTENLAMATGRNRLMPWYVGIFIVLAAVIFVGYEMYATGCASDTPISLALLFVIPLVYLALMYLTLSSQE